MKKQPHKKAAPVKAAAAAPVKAADVRGMKRMAGWICALFAFLLYANTLGHDYTVDDGTVISNNKITKKGISAIPEIFSKSYRAGFWERNEGLYRPLSVAMFAIEWQLAPENPAPGHWINVILYALTALLLFQLLASVFKDYSILLPFATTLLFVALPIHTEVVANIKSRDEILCLLFSVITLQQVFLWMKNQKAVPLVWAAIAYFAAFLSKESAITLVAVIPLFIWFFSETPIQKNVMAGSVFVSVAVVYLIIRYTVLGNLTGSAELQLINNSLLGADSFADRLATAFMILGRYLYLLFIPYPLSFDYSYNQIPVVSFSNGGALIATVVYLLLTVVAFKGIRKKDPIAFGLLFYFATISLVSNVLFLIESTMAERFIYMPSLGFAMALIYVLMKYAGRLKALPGETLTSAIKAKPVFTGIMVVLLVAYSFRTISRNADWKDNITLLSKDVKTSPNSARIRYALGSALLVEKALKEENENAKNGYLDRSIAELTKGVSILPNYAEAWKNLGLAYKEQNNFEPAISAFEKARSYKDFSDADFYVGSGLAYGMAHKYPQALADMSRAIEIDPKNAEAYNNKGLYLSESGNNDSALVYFDKALSLKPDFYQAFYNKGNSYAQQGNFNAAIEQYNKSLAAKPGYVDALTNMGNSYAGMQDYAHALEYYKEVIKAEPGNAKVIFNIGITYRLMGDEASANEYFEKARQAGVKIP